MQNTEISGTRNLIPERIREAREARGYTLETFAEALGITKQAVAQYETGQISPRPDLISLLVRLTEQPPSFFTTARRRSGEHFRSPFWRGLRRMEQHHRLRIARRMEWAQDICAYIERFIELPAVNLPATAFDPDSSSVEDIELAAESARAHWSLGQGPIHALTRVLEANGILLICENVRCGDMDAVSRWQAGRPYILYSQEVESGPRCMYNLAHELGHILLHAGREVDSRNLDLLENQANRFAGAFLLPRASFATEVVSTSIKYFEYLKERWGVSIAAMIYRCRDLRLLSKHQHGYLMRQMNARGIREKEPLDESFQQLRPLVLSEALKMLIDNGVQSKAQIESALSLNVRDIASLCGVPFDFIDSKVVPFRLQPRAS